MSIGAAYKNWRRAIRNKLINEGKDRAAEKAKSSRFKDLVWTPDDMDVWLYRNLRYKAYVKWHNDLGTDARLLPPTLVKLYAILIRDCHSFIFWRRFCGGLHAEVGRKH